MRSTREIPSSIKMRNAFRYSYAGGIVVRTTSTGRGDHRSIRGTEETRDLRSSRELEFEVECSLGEGERS